MKASELKKNPISLNNILEQIKRDNESGMFKSFIAHFIFVDDRTKNELMELGYKLTHGQWMEGYHGLIIEW